MDLAYTAGVVEATGLCRVSVAVGGPQPAHSQHKDRDQCDKAPA